jgi:hypothetical protein
MIEVQNQNSKLVQGVLGTDDGAVVVAINGNAVRGRQVGVDIAINWPAPDPFVSRIVRIAKPTNPVSRYLLVLSSTSQECSVTARVGSALTMSDGSSLIAMQPPRWQLAPDGNGGVLPFSMGIGSPNGIAQGDWPWPGRGDYYDTGGARDATVPWTASCSVAHGGVILPSPAHYNGHIYVNNGQAGTTGGTEPNWPLTSGASVTDGSVTWTESGIDYVGQVCCAFPMEDIFVAGDLVLALDTSATYNVPFKSWIRLVEVI